MAGQTNEGGERRRALHAERAGTGRRAPGHAAPVQPAPDPFTTPAAGTQAVWPAAAPAATPTPALGTTLGTPLGTPLPSRRDRAALRRPTVLDEAAVQASDSAAWRTSPALEDPRTASAISRPSPLTHALARTLTEHLDSLTPPAGLSAPGQPATAARATDAPSAYVPRRRPAPAVSGPLPVVGTTTHAEVRREPSWTTEPVVSRRSLRPETAPTSDAGAPDLPPPPPAAEVEAAVRARAARLSTAPVPPPMPDRVSAEPPVRTSYVVPALPPTGLPPTGLPATGLPATSTAPAGRAGSAPSGPTAALTAADLAVLRTATGAAAATSPTSATPTGAVARAGAAAPETTALPAEPRHGRATGRTTARSSRPGGRAGRAGGRPGAAPETSSAGSSTGRTGSTRPASRDTRWHQRRALGLPVGLLAAAVALAAAVVVGTWSGAPGHDVLTAAMASANRAAAPSEATPAAAAAAADPSAGDAPASATAGESASSADAAAAPAAAADPSTAQASTAASQPAAAAAPSAPASPRTAPLGDVTYEGFGTAKDTYVELGTKDSREVRQDLGATFSKTMAGSKGWPGWYVAVSSLGAKGDGAVGCRIKDADGTVLVEQTSEDGQLVMCTLGLPAGIG